MHNKSDERDTLRLAILSEKNVFLIKHTPWYMYNFDNDLH